jgi:hypothetical protein
MSVAGDREDAVRDLIEKWRVPEEHRLEVYKTLMDRFRLKDEVRRLEDEIWRLLKIHAPGELKSR